MPASPFCLGRCDRPRHVSDADETRGPAVGAVQTQRQMRERAPSSGGCAWCGRSNTRRQRPRRTQTAGDVGLSRQERATCRVGAPALRPMRDQTRRCAKCGCDVAGGAVAGVDWHGSGARVQESKPWRLGVGTTDAPLRAGALGRFRHRR
jgi:hypothetical protein